MNNFWEKNKIPLAIVLAGTVIGLFIYFSRQTLTTPSLTQNTQSPSPTKVEEIMPSPTTIPTEIPLPTTDDNAAIKKAMAEKIKVDEDNLVVTVSKNLGNYATGGVKEKGEMGGAYFLAAKVEGKWVIVYDGQAQPPCNELDFYKFPKELAPECLTSDNKVVKR